MGDARGIARYRRSMADLCAAFGPLVLSVLFAAPALAQPGVEPVGDPSPPATSPQRYEADFFTVYNPLTAADEMLSRIWLRDQ